MLAAALVAAWVQYAADGLPHARAATTASCPLADVNGAPVAMNVRVAGTDGWPASCDLALPANLTRLRVGDRVLPVPKRDVNRILVIGDTGCRIKGKTAQRCNDAAAWPFPSIARAAAAAHPDIIVHVGDYYYRESPCPSPQSGCTGPYGDAWPSWNADWFAPVAPLAAVAPFVLVRGNHESCGRGGLGWFRYLEPSAATECTADTAPFAVDAGTQRIVVFDDNDAEDAGAPPPLVDRYSRRLTDAAALARPGAWLVAHRPPYANATLIAADARAHAYGPFAAILAGHIHTFAALDVASGPPLIINGTGGDTLEAGPGVGLAATALGTRVTRDAAEDERFGYGIYERAAGGWTIRLYDPAGTPLRQCSLAAQVTCGETSLRPRA